MYISPCCKAKINEADCVECDGDGELNGHVCDNCDGGGIDLDYLECSHCLSLFDRHEQEWREEDGA